MKDNDKYFIRGLAMACGILFHGFGEQGTARMVMEEAGFNINDLEEAECDDYDLEGIRKDLKMCPRMTKKKRK